MENRKILMTVKNLLPVIFVIMTAVLSRILPHPPNFAPVTAIALFSGSYLGGAAAFILPLLIMLLSDLMIGFHSTMVYVYLSFLIIVLLGRSAKKNNSLVQIATLSFVSSVLFFLITNFGVWLSEEIYPKNLQGLEQSYIMGLPFFRNTLLGDLFYTLVLFYGFQFLSLLLGKSVPVKKTA
jgi:hypothetical protein